MFDDVTAERFWSKVDKSAGPDACWPWVAKRNAQGYGALRVGPKMVRAHRLAFQFVAGDIIPGFVVRHRCDNPSCCNPSHLQTGTQKQNVADRYDRGRAVHAVGTRHGSAKLTEDQVREIRQLVSSGRSKCSVAKQFGITDFGVRHAIKGWRHVA